MKQAQYEVIIYGATSFVGQIICQYLSEYREEPEVRWAIAGRSESRLDALRNTLKGSQPDILVADAADESALRQLCEKTSVIASTVGPYALYGETLLRICAESGCDYCDLTGEVQWIRRMVDRYQASAQASGARIVNCCGFDSIPSDIGVLYTQREYRTRFQAPSSDIRMRVKAAKGGLSGGTFASLMNVMKEAANDPALRTEMADPYSLCPGIPNKIRQHNPGLAEYDVASESWTSPFIMAAINTRIVQRSNFLMGGPYGDAFRYQESMIVGRGLSGRVKATAVGSAMAAFMLGAAIKPGRWLLEKLLPAPGEGPSPEEQRKGFYDLRFFACDNDAVKLRTKVTGDRDPGYGSTAKMISQAAICLARDISSEDCAGGLWTPASAMGEKLLPRLEKYAGLTFSVIGED